MTDSRSVAQNVPNEPGNFCHTTENKSRSYQKLQESRPKEKRCQVDLDSNGHKMEQLSVKEDNYHNKLKHFQ